MKKIAFLLFILLSVNVVHAQDYALTRFIEPGNQPVCTGTGIRIHPELVDSGLTGIASGALQIHWTIGALPVASASCPAAPVTAGNSDTLTLDTITFNRPGAYTLIAYIDSADANNSNDTLIMIVQVGMNGLYTINPALPATGNNFTSVASFCDTLSDGGVCGPVTASIANGVYNEQATITNVNGVSSINNIHITSEAADSSAVTIRYAPTGSSDNYVILIRATPYLTLSYVTLENYSSASYGRVISTENNCSRLHVHHVHFVAGATTVNSNALALFYSNPGTDTNDSLSIFENNTFERGAYGLYLYGVSSASTEDSVVVRTNVLRNQYASGIFLYNQSNTRIDSNVIVTSATTSSYSGIYLRYANGKISIERNTIIADGAAGDIFYLRDVNGDAVDKCIVANNFIVQKNNASTVRALYPYNCQYIDLVFNTIRVQGGSSTGGRAIYINSSTGGSYGNIRLLNNIAENSGGGFAIEITSAAITQNYLQQCDYNDYLCSGTVLGKYGSTNCADIGTWQAAVLSSGFDLHSVNIDPVFTGPSDVQFTSAALNGLATPLSSVQTDIEGKSRNITQPDMGAYEYELFSNDIAIISIIAPASGCGLSSATPVTIAVFNNGSSNANNIPVSFSSDGGVSWCFDELIPSLLSGDTIVYTFLATSDLATPFVYDFRVRHTYPGDENTSNDHLASAITSYANINVFPYSESFESGAGYWTTGGTLSSWALGEPAGSVIDTAADGINAWVTHLSGLYNINERSFVESPCFQLDGMSDPWLEMSIWFEAESGWDGAQLQFSTNGGHSWQTLGLFGDPNWYNDNDVDGITNNAAGWSGHGSLGSGSWINVSHSLQSAISVNGTRLRVYFGSGNFNTYEGFAFDHVRIADRGTDISPISVDAPDHGCLTGTQPIAFSVANYGTLTTDTIVVRISDDNGGSWINDTIPAVISSGDTMQLISNHIFDFSIPGQRFFIISALEPGDVNTFNDTLHSILHVQPIIQSYPYFDDMETPFSQWLTEDSLWQHGTPAGNIIQNAYSGSNAISTCHQGVYSAGINGMASSPCFDFSTLTWPEISFMYFNNSDSAIDGSVLQYSIDGVNWTNAGLAGDTLQWFNQDSIAALSVYGNGDGWSGSTQSGWLLARHSFPQLAGQPWVKFRFIFSSISTGFDGFAFDDFSIVEKPVYNLQLVSIDSLSDACELGMENIQITLQNGSGAYTIPAGDTIIASLYVNAAHWVTDSIILAGTLAPMSGMSHTFSLPVNMSAAPMTYELSAVLYSDKDVLNSDDSSFAIVMTIGNPQISLPEDTSLCDNESILLSANAGSSWLWSTGSTLQQLLVDTALAGGYGDYIVYVTAYDQGCMASDTMTISFTSCIGNEDHELAASIWPNPSNGMFFIQIDQTEFNGSYEITDLSGRTVMNGFLTSGKNSIDAQHLQEGWYAVRILIASETQYFLKINILK